MMGNLQASLSLILRITSLMDSGKATLGMTSMCKSYCADLARENAKLG